METPTEYHWSSRFGGRGLSVGPANPPHERYYATETNATVQQQQKVLGQQREDCHEASNMTLEYESRKDVRKPRTSLMDPKSKIRIGCWSVRTMFETENQHKW